MGMWRNLLRSVPAVTLAGAFVAGAVSVADAQDTTSLSKYYGAIRAYELCNDTQFDQDQYLALTRAINDQTNTNLSVGEDLTVIEEAQNEAWDLVFKYQCDSEPVGELLTLFQSDLAPALQ